MTEIPTPSSPLASTSSAITGSATSWRQLLRVVAGTTIVASVAMMSLGRFVGPSLVVLALAMAIGWWLLRRSGRAGVLVVGLFSVANLVMHGAIFALQLSLPESPASFLAGLTLGLASLLGVTVAVPAWRGLPYLRTAGRDLVLKGGSVVLIGGALVSALLFATRTSDPVEPGDLRLTTTGLEFATHRLAAAAGSVTVDVRNDDPIWPRSFDIDTLGVHVLVPPATTRRITFTVTPGTYRFYDNATATAATRGTLVVAP